jgi:hypothetical protein
VGTVVVTPEPPETATGTVTQCWLAPAVGAWADVWEDDLVTEDICCAAG